MNADDFLRGHPAPHVGPSGARFIATYEPGVYSCFVSIETPNKRVARPMDPAQARDWFLSILPRVEHPDRWQAGNDGSGKLRWFVYRRPLHERGPGFYSGSETHRGVSGRVLRYASGEAAQRVADALNAKTSVDALLEAVAD